MVRFGNASGPTAGLLRYTTDVADSRSYSVCNAQSPMLHMATMEGLVAGQDYYYSIDGEKSGCGSTPPQLFTAPKVVGDAATAYPFTLLAYSDMGISNSEYTAAFITDMVASQKVDVIVHSGDISCEFSPLLCSAHTHQLR